MIIPLFRYTNDEVCRGCGINESVAYHDLYKPHCPFTLSRVIRSCAMNSEIFYCDIHDDSVENRMIVVFGCQHAICLPCSLQLLQFICPFCRNNDKVWLIVLNDEVEEEKREETTDRYVCLNPVDTHLCYANICEICDTPALKIYGTFSTPETVSTPEFRPYSYGKKIRYDKYCSRENRRIPRRESF